LAGNKAKAKAVQIIECANKAKAKGKGKQAEKGLLKRSHPEYDSRYTRAFKKSGHLMRAGGSQRKVSKQMEDEFNVKFCASTAYRSKDHGDVSPVKKGREPAFPVAAEKVLVNMIIELRLLKLTVNGSTGGEDREVVLLGAILTPIHSAVALRPCV
jgi:hypothetical protein